MWSNYCTHDHCSSYTFTLSLSLPIHFRRRTAPSMSWGRAQSLSGLKGSSPPSPPFGKLWGGGGIWGVVWKVLGKIRGSLGHSANERSALQSVRQELKLVRGVKIVEGRAVFWCLVSFALLFHVITWEDAFVLFHLELKAVRVKWNVITRCAICSPYFKIGVSGHFGYGFCFLLIWDRGSGFLRFPRPWFLIPDSWFLVLCSM